jgi:ATP-binding cassette subfamily B protein/subfamily B ATP-binding cassette protein MsbA
VAAKDRALVQTKIQNPQSKIAMSIYRRVLAYYRPFSAQTALGLFLSLAAIGLSLLKPWPFKIIVDDILARNPNARFGNSPSLIPLLCLALVAIQLLWGLLNLASNYLFVKIGLQALLKLRTDLYAYLQSLSLKYHDARRSSDSSFRVAYDSQSIQTIYNKGFTNIFGSGVMLLGTFCVMLQIDWQLTLLSLAIVPAIVAAIYFFAHRIRRDSTTIQEQESALLAQAQEGLSSVRMVHAFGREEWEVRQFHLQAQQSLHANLRLTLTNVNSALVISTLMVLGTAAMYYLGTLHVLAGTLSLGSLLVFSAYLLMLYQPLESLTYTAWAMEGATAGARRCFEVLDRSDDVVDAPDAREIDHTDGALAFANVNFSYGPAQSVLTDINLSIAPNQIVALVGGTGAGKSTLLSLVPRFYDPSSGAVQLDGLDLRTITKKSLRSQIAIVLQDTVLFSTTVRENIAYGRPGATDEDIREAARRAQADNFITRLPNGYDSPVGERGGHLSVGQRQRIGIARAFLKDAPILLLDEPTSALDPSTEAAIMETIKDLMRGRTTLIVTHRLATIHNVNQIVVLENGRIVEQGRGPELVARGGVYARLYASGNYPS